MIGPHAQSYGMLSGNILLDQCIAGFDPFRVGEAACQARADFDAAAIARTASQCGEKTRHHRPLTLMYGPAVRCKRFSSIRQYGLASMYPTSDWSVCSGPSGYQRACELISGQASNGPFGSPVFVCAGKTDPPSSSYPLADLGG
jgi:hypothetical protein